jgi:NADP-dependent 3-hydroxy acid dehydrogenase YdfG
MLEDRIIVVTGASSGIGAAAAQALAAEGARVMLAARRANALQELCENIRCAGGIADHLVVDMRREADVERLVQTTVDRFGCIDALVNNAAYGTVRTIADGRSDEWRAMLETNVLGPLAACRAALRYMLPAGKGDILNVTSASAHEAWPYLSVYAASKAALHSLSAGLRAEVAHLGIRVMTLEVHNVTGTDFATNFDGAIMGEAIQRWQQLGLLRRDSPMLRPEEAAAAIVFQLSRNDPASVHHVALRSRAN